MKDIVVLWLLAGAALTQNSFAQTSSVAVTFTSDPPQSTVYVDDVKKGVTPLSLRLPAGEHKIRVAKYQFDDYHESMSILDTDTLLMVKAFLPSLTTLSIVTLVPSIVSTGEVKIFMDGQFLGFPPIEKYVTQGKHTLRAVAETPCLKEYSKTITVVGDINLVTQMELFMEFSDSFVVVRPEVKEKIKNGEVRFVPVTTESQSLKATKIPAAVQVRTTTKAVLGPISSPSGFAIIVLVIGALLFLGNLGAILP